MTEVWNVPSDATSPRRSRAARTPEEHPNVATFRAAEEARARNKFDSEDLGHIERFLREDVKWISPWGKGPESREEVVRAVRARSTRRPAGRCS